MRKKDLALRVLSTATFLAMVASCITPAFAGTYYIEDGNITIETEGDRVKVNGAYDDDEEIIIKGGTNPNKSNAAEENQPEEKTETSAETAENPVEAEDKTEEAETEDAADTEEEEDGENAETPEEGESQDDAEAQNDGKADEEEVEQKQDEKTPAEDAEAEETVEEKQDETKPQQDEEAAQKEETTVQEISAPVSKAAKTSDDSEENSPKSSDPVKNVIKVVNNWVDKILNITLDNVNVDATGKGSGALTIKGSGDTTIHLEGQNKLNADNLHAGLEKNDSESTGKLIVTAKDTNSSLEAIGQNGGAGIGGKEYEGSSKIEIAGGKIIATGGHVAAGIGGGRKSDGEVTISGGDITALGGSWAAGIGGGSAGAGKVTITNGTIKSASRGGGSAIGGNDKSKVVATGGNITVVGSTSEIDLGEDSTAVIAKVDSEHQNVSHNWKETSHKDAGIDQHGETVYTCTDENCGATKTEYTPITGHDWDDGEITTAPTCTETGVRTYTCKNDDATKTEEVAALGHDYGEWVADGEGHKTRTCSRCDASETVADENYVAPVDPIPDVQPNESSDSSAAAYEALTVVGAPAYEQTVENHRVVIAVPAQRASLRGSLGALKELKAQGAEILVFRTQLCESAVSIDALLARGSDETIFVLTHTESNAALTIAGQNADALLNT